MPTRAGHEAVVAVAVHGRRQPQHGRADAAVRQGQRELRRLPADLRAAGHARAGAGPCPSRSVATRPGASPSVPDAMTSGRSEPASTSPNVSTAWRSALGRVLEAAGERDVVLEREVDHAVRRGRRAAQDVEVIDRAALHLGPGGGEGGGRGVRAGQPGDLMARVDELGNDGGADPAGRAGDENSHGKTSR